MIVIKAASGDRWRLAPELDVKGQPGFKARAADRSRRPPYMPQFVTKQRELMFTASLADPGIHCYPLGVPRLGPPTEIAHMPHVIYFMYEGGAARPGQRDFRIIPIGAKHQTDRDPFPNGDSIAYWEGDTLVVDVVNIDDCHRHRLAPSRFRLDVTKITSFPPPARPDSADGRRTMPLHAIFPAASPRRLSTGY